MEEQDGMRKRYEVKITRHAEQSMREIGTYIATDLMSPETAVKMLGSFQTEIMKLSALPQRVHLTPEEPWHSLGIRRMRIKNYYVYFWVDEVKEKVQIMDFVHVGRDQQRQLEKMARS